MDAHRCLHYRWTQEEEKINKNQWTESWRCRIGPNVRHPIQVGLRERLFVVVERGGYWLRLDFGPLRCSALSAPGGSIREKELQMHRIETIFPWRRGADARWRIADNSAQC